MSIRSRRNVAAVLAVIALTCAAVVGANWRLVYVHLFCAVKSFAVEFDMGVSELEELDSGAGQERPQAPPGDEPSEGRNESDPPR